MRGRIHWPAAITLTLAALPFLLGAAYTGYRSLWFQYAAERSNGTVVDTTADGFRVLAWVVGIPGLALAYWSALLYVPLGRKALAEGRAARPGLKIGVCGEHGGDPESVHFFHAAGLDYVSCSPFRVPVARMEAGRAALSGTGAGDSR